MFDAMESGVLSFDGDLLTFETEEGSSSRLVSEREQKKMLTVTPENAIPQCQGFQLFLIVDE